MSFATNGEPGSASARSFLPGGPSACTTIPSSGILVPPPLFMLAICPVRSTFALVAGTPETTTSTAFDAVGVRSPHADVKIPTSPFASGRFS